MTIVVRDSQDPSQIVSNRGAAAITGAGSLLSVKVINRAGDNTVSKYICKVQALTESFLSPVGERRDWRYPLGSDQIRSTDNL